jgi:hypothetical protein
VVARYPDDPRRQVEALFEAQLEIAKSNECRGCALGNAAAEITDDEDELSTLVRAYKDKVRKRLHAMARAMGAREAEVLGDALMLLLDGGYFTRLVFPLGSGPISAALSAVRTLIDLTARRVQPEILRILHHSGWAVLYASAAPRTSYAPDPVEPAAVDSVVEEWLASTALRPHRSRLCRTAADVRQGLRRPLEPGVRDLATLYAPRFGVEAIHGGRAAAAGRAGQPSLDDRIEQWFPAAPRRRCDAAPVAHRIPAESETTGRRIFSLRK